MTYRGKCSICKEDHCHFSQSYLEGSHLSGPLFWDTVWLGGNIFDEAHIPIGDESSRQLYGIHHQFGCFITSGGLFKAQLADGIVGLAPRELSFIGSFQKQIQSFKKLHPTSTIQEMFSFCFIEGGGYMTLGGYDSTTLTEPICWTPFSSTERYFRVSFTSVYFGSQRAFLNIGKWNANQGVMIDSGSTFTYLVSSEFKVFAQALVTSLDENMVRNRVSFPKVTRVREHNCYRLRSADDLRIFPTLLITLQNDCTLAVEGRFYMFKAEGTIYCFGVYSDPMTVIGNNFLQGHNAVFDLGRSRWGLGAANISLQLRK